METTPTHGTRNTFPSVLFVTRAYPPVRGGMEHLSFELTSALASRMRTSVIANRYGRTALPLFVPWAFLRAFFRLPRYDILHVGDPVLAALGCALKTLRKRPIAMTVHGLDILYPSPLFQRYLRRFLGCADLYVCISAFVERTLKEQFGITRTVVIPPGISDTFYRPETTRAELLAAIGVPADDRPLLLTVGRLVRRKGVSWFIANVLPRLETPVRYLVIGDGPDRADAEASAQRAGVADRVIFAGAVDDQAVRLAYNAADLFLMPNILVAGDAEGFGLVALEAASCELPVIASALEGIVDAVYDGRNGLLVEAGNPGELVSRIHTLLGDPAERERLGVAARAFTLQRFSWNTIAEKYLETFNYLRRL